MQHALLVGLRLLDGGELLLVLQRHLLLHVGEVMTVGRVARLHIWRLLELEPSSAVATYGIDLAEEVLVQSGGRRGDGRLATC